MDALVSRDLFFFSVEQKFRQPVAWDGQGCLVVDDNLAHLARRLLFDLVLLFLFFFLGRFDGHLGHSLLFASLCNALAVPLKEVAHTVLARPKLSSLVRARFGDAKNCGFQALALFCEHFFEYFRPDTHLFFKKWGDFASWFVLVSLLRRGS